MKNVSNSNKIVYALINTRVTGKALCVFKMLYHAPYRWVPYSELNLAAGFNFGSEFYNTNIAQVIRRCGLWDQVIEGNEGKLPKTLFLLVSEKVRSDKYFQLTAEFRGCINSCGKLLDILALSDDQLCEEFLKSKLLELCEKDFSDQSSQHNIRVPEEIAAVVEKKAIELRAMDVVATHYRDRGWSIEDTSKSNPEGSGTPFDFRITKGDKKKYVEVKGASKRRERVTLTANEVQHARDHSSQSVLVVVSGIRIRVVDGHVIGEDGQISYHKDPWRHLLRQAL